MEEKKFVKTTAGRIYYFKNFINRKKPTIVFLHGLSANHSTWNMITKKLNGLGYNTLTIDLRGHGYSDKTKTEALYDLKNFSEDIKLILRQEKLDKIILAGYSFGGSIALDFSSSHHELISGLILISANHKNPLSYNSFKYSTPLAVAFLKIASFIMLWQKRKKYFYYHPERIGGYWRSTWQGLKTMPWSINGWMLLQMVMLDLSEKINRIKAPILIIYSKNDPFLSEKEIEEIIGQVPHAKVIASKNNSHFIATRAYDELTQIILNFLKKYENSDF